MKVISRYLLHVTKWQIRISLILILAVAYSVFMDGGWSSPQELHATVAISSCADCHSYPPTDGTRSGATGQF